jgi:enterochelin esterase-like enzyme
MSLTGWLFLLVMVALTLAAAVGLLIRWSHLAGREPTRLLARGGLLLLVNGLVVLTAGVAVNDHFGFYSSWTDLAGGSSRAGGTVERSGGAASRAAAAVVRGAAAPSGGRLEPPENGRRLDHDTVRYRVSGPRSGITADVLVTVPPGYGEGDLPSGGYPVMEVFGGYPAQPIQWVTVMHLPEVMAQLVSAGKLRDAIIVAPQVEIPAGADTECVNGVPGRPQIETWITLDVPAWLVSHFQAATKRSSWVAMGLSAGGWCAAMTTLLHPEQYGAAIVFGGYFRPDFTAGYRPYPISSPLASRYDLGAALLE